MGIQSLNGGGGTDWAKKIPKAKSSYGSTVTTYIVLDVAGAGFLHDISYTTTTGIAISVFLDGTHIGNYIIDSDAVSSMSFGAWRFNSSLTIYTSGTTISSVGVNYVLD